MRGALPERDLLQPPTCPLQRLRHAAGRRRAGWRGSGSNWRVAGRGPSCEASRVTLEDLTPGARVLGVLPDQPVTVVAAEWHGTQALTLTFRDETGRVDHQLLYRG